MAMIKKEGTLLYKFPELAKEWDYDNNGDINPSNISCGSSKEVFWICPICHHSYLKKVSNRTSPSKRKSESKFCPICLGRIIIPGYNSLKAKFPDIIREEWDFSRNKVDPDTIAPHQNKIKHWWICKKGHSYQAVVNNKISNNGGNCPYCSHEKLLFENSLSFVNPKLAKEWNYEKNKLTPEKVFANANSYAWWICDKGHKWKAKICNRNNGKGCPICAKGHHSSFPEQVIYHYINKMFPDALNGYKYKNYEIDIYVPSVKLGIEYDGEYFHKSANKIERDNNKNNLLFNDGIDFIRVRESNCPNTNNNCVIFRYNYTSDYHSLERILVEVLSFIANKYNKEVNFEVSIDSIKNQLLDQISTVSTSKSLLHLNKNLCKDWNYELNYPLEPKMFYPNSSVKIFWKCHKCSYVWKATIGSRNQGCGCPSCSNREHYNTNSWIKKAKKAHGDNYDYSKVNYINSKTPVIISCPKHGDFSQNPTEHLLGKGCKYCAHQAFHPEESLAKLYPDISKEWNYELNKKTGFTPNNIGINSTIKFYWHCNYGKPHSYLATIYSRVYRHSGCAVCHGKQITFDTSVAFLRSDLVNEWCDSNIYKPSEVSLGSTKKIMWKCSNPIHKPYLASVYSRVHLKSGCPECSGNIKSSQSYSLELNNKHPNIELLSEYIKSNIRIKCRCKICEHEWEPFPYNLLKGYGCPICKNKNIIKK